MWRWATAVAAIVFCVTVGAAKAGDDEVGLIFRWVDKAGNLHVTDRLGDVPEPYYSSYVAELKRRAALREQRGEAGQPSAPAVMKPPEPIDTVPAGPSVVDQEIDRRNRWRKEVADWRAELHAATAFLAQIEGERAQVSQNPLLVHTPQVRAAVAEIDQRRATALARVEKARRMLLEELPQRARRENVPPKWLE